MKSVKYGLTLLLIVFFVIQSNYTQTTDKDLPNFAKVNDNLYRGGQPSEAGFKKLAALGVKTVIDLRGADKRAKREEKWARAAGLNFINKPLNNWLRPRDAQIEEIERLLETVKNQPVFVHCKRGADRTGTIIAVYRIRRDGWDAKRANEEAESLGFGWWQFQMRDYINDYYRDFKTK